MNDDFSFQETVWEYYRRHGRHDLPWRSPDPDGSFNPYKIMVSELMLQQTQVTRVIPKYEAFLEQFPTLQTLAEAELGNVLRSWTGLGYNRRAKFLHQASQTIVTDLQGGFPDTLPGLVALPGIGPNTAGAILAYAYNQPVSFLETNIRTVYIYHYFANELAVSDAQLQPIVSRTTDLEHPREWYWALMDYGSYLKQTVGNHSRQSKTYAKQSTFAGSRRQVRGKVITLLTSKEHTLQELEQAVQDERLAAVLAELQAEGLIRYEDKQYLL